MSIVINGTSGITFSNGTAQTSAAKSFITHQLTSGTTFTPNANTSQMYVAVFGSIGGKSGAYTGGRGGRGFSEKLYTAPLSATYSYSIGAAGTTSGTAGGTTTFGVMSVTGSGGVTTNTGSSGGVGSGGDYNATGGTGGNGDGTYGGGGGGAATRAGNGGNGANQTGSYGGGGGGTGGNNASGITGGAAASAKAAGAINLSTLLGVQVETFAAGTSNTSSATGQNGADSGIDTDLIYITLGSLNNTTSSTSSNVNGSNGVVFIVEILG